MRGIQRVLISVAALVLSFGGLTAVAQATPDTGGLTANNPGNQSGNVGITINTLQLSCSGGFPPCVWTTSGLPAGLTSNTAGQINGLPTTHGTYTVTATARDNHNATSSTSFTWTLTNNLVASNPGNQTSTVGVAISPVQLHCYGGTPTTAGTYNVGITVKDIAGTTASTSFTWTVN